MSRIALSAGGVAAAAALAVVVATVDNPIVKLTAATAVTLAAALAVVTLLVSARHEARQLRSLRVTQTRRTYHVEEVKS